ncbi:hypothetical protein FA15DRAFT_709094 [Coprinopsis marcescibilis]|uniref:Uncharacterized protein n=1 Tax=Coprinopsis marcescibilis TaxID=230819 RepID=A0A5C3KGR5_COPMA|nr:hypothetical protein FA15DRAFT_709094 [Coprinopsis marcescibilis]
MSKAKSSKNAQKRQSSAKTAFKKKNIKAKANNEQLLDILDKQSTLIHESSLLKSQNNAKTTSPNFSASHNNQIPQNSMNDLAAILQGI